MVRRQADSARIPIARRPNPHSRFRCSSRCRLRSCCFLRQRGHRPGYLMERGSSRGLQLEGYFQVSCLSVRRTQRLICRFLIGDSLGAKADLEKSLDIWPEFVQSWVKIASVHMELGQYRTVDFGTKLTNRGQGRSIWRFRGCHPTQPRRPRYLLPPWSRWVT